MNEAVAPVLVGEGELRRVPGDRAGEYAGTFTAAGFPYEVTATVEVGSGGGKFFALRIWNRPLPAYLHVALIDDEQPV